MGEYSGMSSFKLKACILTTVFLFCISYLPAIAQENIISSVVISKSKEKPNAYELNIDSTEVVDYKINTDEEGVYFDLKNSTLAEDIGTVYDDVSNIDNVVIKQLNNNKVRIYVKGKDAKNTELVFVNSLFETSKDNSKKIVINRPISEYQPTNHLNDLDSEEDIQDWSDNSFNFSHLIAELLSNIKQGSMGIILIFLSIFAAGAVVIKNLAAKISQDREPLIGLNSSKISNNNELQSVSNRMEALKNAQSELNKAHQKYQNYLQNKYKNVNKEKTNSINIDSIKKGIALSQYQKSTQNPYLNQEVIKINKDFTNTIPQGNFQIPPRPKKTVQSDFSSPYIQRKNNKINYTPKTNEKSSSTKFLESVTKIYEQSGRKDLATGLKNSISKAKQSI